MLMMRMCLAKLAGVKSTGKVRVSLAIASAVAFIVTGFKVVDCRWEV